METLKRRSIRVGLLAAPLLFLGAMADGHGGDSKLIHACVHKHDGNVRIVGSREHCRRYERSLHWVREVPAPAPAPAPAPTGAVELVDGDGTVMGPVVSVFMNFPIFGLRREGRVYQFLATNFPPQVAASLSGFDTLYFSEPNCQGTPFLVRGFSPFPATAVDPSGNGYGDPGPNVAPSPQTLGSSFGAGDCAPLDPAENPGDVVPALQLFAAGEFTQPFSVR